MPETPDSRPGPLIEDEKIILAPGDLATVEGEITYTGDRFSLFDDVTGEFDPSNGYPPAFKTAYNNIVSPTDLPGWQDKLSLQTDDLELGSYIIFVRATLSGTKSNSEYEVRAQINNADEIDSQKAQAGIADSEQGFAAYTVRSAFSGVNQIDIDFRKVSGSGYVKIRGARIAYWRISAE